MYRKEELDVGGTSEFTEGYRRECTKFKDGAFAWRNDKAEGDEDVAISSAETFLKDYVLLKLES